MFEIEGTEDVKFESVFPEMVDMAWVYFSGVAVWAVLILMVLAISQ